MPRIRALAVALTAAALLLAGCATAPRPAPPSDTAPGDIVSEISCAGMDPLGGDAGAAGVLPDGFEPVAVVRCLPFQQTEDNQGIWSVVARETLEGDLTEVLALQAQADDPPTSGPCSAVLMLPPLVWLTDAEGRGIRLRIPVDGCSQPKVALLEEALAALTVTRSDEEQRTLTQPRAAIDAGCAPVWAAQPLQLASPEELQKWEGTEVAPRPAPTLDEEHLVPWTPPRVPAPGEVDRLTLCAYSTDPSANPASTPAPGATTWVSVQVDGQAWFTGARELDAAETGAVLEAAASAQPLAEPCDEILGSLVVLSAGGTTAPMTVELDGCRRLIVDFLTTYAAPAELLDLLG
ncbi:hypothetical protein R8Z57_12700 [Microbacterium sp. M3]|uniref:DUF3515 domain-containing protein n=1 Tax=Microbacterium arthrosphaerae TaxID=792652 RepID=A0ABU4H2R4_9MICO|nr:MULTISPECIES: hypothetical protein [Microbacterium]MDW4573632.1 hypothetical protein [Microbacterium arthrosphaerae]MDW7607487.1 hypothetical protein [Microbacterium sp. M3]